MLPYNVIAATQEALRQRTDYMEQGQTLLLATRITPTTVDPVTGLAAVRCPDCFDPQTRQTTVPNDPTCLGVGWIVAASGSVAQQGGYLSAVPLDDAFINANQDMTQWSPQGIVAFSADVLYVLPGTQLPKKGDVAIQTGPMLSHSRRYVLADESDPKTLGSAILFYTWTLEYRQSDSPVYRIPPADLSGLTPGAWS